MGVVGIVDDVPCRIVGSMACVASVVRPPCVGSLAPRSRLERGVDYARDRGSVEAEIVPEAKGSGETEIAPEAKGLGETEIALEAKGSGVAFVPFCRFFPLNLGIPFYGTQQWL